MKIQEFLKIIPKSCKRHDKCRIIGDVGQTEHSGRFQLLEFFKFWRQSNLIDVYLTAFINYTAGQPRDGPGYFVAFYLVALYFAHIYHILPDLSYRLSYR